MCRNCGNPECPEPEECPPPSRSPFPIRACKEKLKCSVHPKRYSPPPQSSCPIPCLVRSPPCQPPCPSTGCPLPPQCPPKPCFPPPPCTSSHCPPCKSKRKSKKPCVPQSCSICPIKTICPDDSCQPNCSYPCYPTCLPPCPPNEICCPEQRCYFARNCCCGASMSKYLTGATVDTVILETIDAVKDVMNYLEDCCDDPDYYKNTIFQEECIEEKIKKKRLKDYKKAIECQPICIIPPDKCNPPCWK